MGMHTDPQRWQCLLPHVHAQRVKQYQVLGICVCCKHNESVDIGEKLVSMHFELLKWLTSAINRAFSVLHAC